MRRRLAWMLATAATAALAVPASAAADQSYDVSGTVTYTWQGDPARGCAAEGLCGVQGALALDSQASSGSSSGPAPGLVAVPLDPSRGTVRVVDGPGGGECVDAPSGVGGAEIVIARRGGELVGQIEGFLSSGRCAGPRQQDLARIVLPVRRTGSGGKRVTYDLRSSHSFAAGPFTGRVISTVVIRSSRGGGGSQTVTSGPAPVAPRPTHKVLLEQATLRYGLASVQGEAFDVAFSGESDPFCGVLDSCGATGTLAFTLPRFEQTLVVRASRPVPRRVGARQALADLRRGRLHRVEGEVLPSRAGITAQVAETFAGAGGFRCQDTSQTLRAEVFLTAGPARSGGGMALALSPNPSELLRTRCPGPADADVFGSPGRFGINDVARASIGSGQLLARHTVISMPWSGSFAGLGYVGTRSGALEFSLALQQVRVGTVEVTR